MKTSRLCKSDIQFLEQFGLQAVSCLFRQLGIDEVKTQNNRVKVLLWVSLLCQVMV